MWGLSVKVAICNQARGASPETSTDCTSWTSSLQTEKIHVCYLSHPKCHVLLCQSKLMDWREMRDRQMCEKEQRISHIPITDTAEGSGEQPHLHWILEDKVCLVDDFLSQLCVDLLKGSSKSFDTWPSPVLSYLFYSEFMPFFIL